MLSTEQRTWLVSELPSRQHTQLSGHGSDKLLYEQMRKALSAASTALGVDATDAELMRLHASTVFRLSKEQAVARITTGGNAAERISFSLRVTAWLSDQGFSHRPAED